MDKIATQTPEDSPGSGPSTGLLSFYDRLRERVAKALAGNGGEGTQTSRRLPSDLLLLIPDVFIFLVRLAVDKEVPKDVRALIGGALAYFLLPFDLLPEALLGIGGFADDVVLAVLVLTQAFDDDLEYFAQKHWSGSGDLREQLAKVAKTANSLLGEDMAQRVRQMLAKITQSGGTDRG